MRIEILNKVSFLFDNDAEGVGVFRRLHKLLFPSNLRTMDLPSLEEFRHFATRGPNGIRASDVNG